MCAFHLNAQNTPSLKSPQLKSPQLKSPTVLPVNKDLVSVSVGQWGAKKGGLRVEIRIANDAFLQQYQDFRERSKIGGRIVMIDGYTEQKAGELVGHYNVRSVDAESSQKMLDNIDDYHFSVFTEGDYTVFRRSYHGITGPQQFGYSLDLAHDQNSYQFLQHSLQVNGNTTLDGTVANASTFGGNTIVITIHKSNLR